MHAMAAPNDKPVITASNVVVTLDAYSGRPNPTWSMAEGMTVEFLRRLHALDGSKAAPREFEDLGYRAVSAEFQDETKGTVVVKASRGIVTLDRAGQRSHYLDAGRQFELWLVNTGAAHLTPDILRYVTGEIAKPQ
jgi:lipoprotein-anchoring transpeptidase ErfK/SrfK